MEQARGTSGSKGKSKKGAKKFTELTDEQRKKFEQLVVPNIPKVKQLVAYYSTNPTYFDDNYSCALEDLACYIDNFDTSRMDKLNSWIHVVVKNCVNKSNERNRRAQDLLSSVPCEEYTSRCTLISSNHSEMNLFDGISDEMYNALMKIPAFKLEPFLYSVQGYSVKEIIEIEMKNGNLKVASEYAIKCRIFSAKNILYKELYGYKRPTMGKNNKDVSKGGKGASQ